jgi:hypothetical protein
MKIRTIRFIPWAGCFLLLTLIPVKAQNWQPMDTVDVALVWSGHPVGFALLTNGPVQYACYYDQDRHMTLASRILDEANWTYQPLPSTTGWDMHNYITMALDRDGFLHVSGNMHGDPLVYFRMTEKDDVASMVQESMTGESEDRVTYPKFFYTGSGDLLFMYRDGGSGNGRRFINIYDTQTGTWGRYIDVPLLDGTQWDMNAYPSSIIKGPDDWYHMHWVWRDTPVASTCHDLSYVKSPNLKDWFTAGGDSLVLPLTPVQTGAVVDPAPSSGGLINMGIRLSFDAEDRPILSYHKYDRAPPETGNSQIYNARWETDHWNIVQASDWSYRWEFDRTGSIPNEISAGAVTIQPDGLLRQTYNHVEYGSGFWLLDPLTLLPVQQGAAAAKIGRTLQDFDFYTRTTADRGAGTDPNARYVMVWQTLGPNNDQPRPEPWPEPTMLKVIKSINTDPVAVRHGENVNRRAVTGPDFYYDISGRRFRLDRYHFCPPAPGVSYL